MRRSKLALIVYWTVAALAVVLLSLWAADVSQGAISDCIDATCRITATDGSRGTGCVFEISRDHVYVLTAAHVVGANQTAQCEFWRHGHRSQPIPGRVISRVENDHCDAAVVVLEQSQFGGILPKVIPVAPPSHIVGPGATLTSVGCANGAWSTGWKGHALGYRGADLHFTPSPANGRSGSALFDAQGTQIVGLLRARTADGSEGIACSLQSLYKYLGGKAERGKRNAGNHSPLSASGPARAQCGPDGCPAPKPYLLPYRYQQQFRNPPKSPPQQPVWPTLPGPAPATPSVDLSETNQRLDKIAELLLLMKTERGSAAQDALPEPIAPPDPAAKAAANHVAEVGARLDTTQEALQGLQATVKTWIDENGSLKQQMGARLEKVRQQLGEEASRREVRIAYLKDLIAEKMAGGGVVGLLKLLGMPTGMIIAAWLVSRRIQQKRETGEPLLIQKLLADVGELRGRLHSRLRPTESEEEE